MFPTVFLPWWAWVYLLFVLVTYVFSWSVDAARSRHNVVSSSLSLFTICVCVVGFFNSHILSVFGIMIVPMVAVGVYWEFTRAVQESEIAHVMLDGDPELTDGERDFLLNTAIGFNACVVLPGYVMGLILCLNILGVI
tara:strand:+ start:918 stop:1331 length:414 start_codon:yes stop_codon:yes gene_type:complete